MDYANEIQKKQKRWGSLVQERSSWMSHWQEIARYLFPRSGQFLSSDRNRGEKKHNHIYDSSGTRSARVLAAGLQAGVTSPARPWFALRTPDDDLNEKPAVKQWLSIVEKRMRHIFNDSNTYRALHTYYRDLGVFGTSCGIVEPNFDFVTHHTPLPIGSYALALGALDNVNTVYREFELTVAQVVEKFGIENVSHRVKGLYDQNRMGLDKWIKVIHAIEPRLDRDTRKRDPLNMPWRSCYFEADATEGKYLRESGYKRYRALTPRWDVQPGDIYGGSPGMEALGDAKQLQHQQLRKGQGIDFQTQPPLQVPSSLRGSLRNLPGGLTFHDQAGAGAGVRPLYDVQLKLGDLLVDIQDVRQRLSRTFYEDLFLMISNDTRSNITATEIAERHEEKLLMLGPVLERLHNELLSPLIDITFDDMLEAGLVPPPPPELQNTELLVNFVSILAQAQKAVGLAGVDRLIGLISVAAPVKPEMLDKLDTDQMVDVYADMLGVDPSMIVADKNVAIIREQRQQQAAAQQAALAAPEIANTAKTLSDIDTSKQSALTDMAKVL